MTTSHRREQLAHRVSGAVHGGSDPAGVSEASGFNTAVTHRPELVVAAAHAGDVAAAVRFAGEEGMQVTVQAAPPGCGQGRLGVTDVPLPIAGA